MNRFLKIIDAHGSRNTGDNLLGFEIDMEHYLEDSDLFKSVSINRSTSSACMLQAICIIKPDIDIEFIKKRIENIWLNDLRYSQFEDHEVFVDEKSIKLNFVTIASGLGIIGEIVCKY